MLPVLDSKLKLFEYDSITKGVIIKGFQTYVESVL